jgi:hypothetical protein
MKHCIAAFLAIAVWLPGCGGRTDSGNSAADPNKDRGEKTTNDPYAARLDAALAIGIPSDRNDALKTVALDAAEAGKADIVKKAIAGIGFLDMKAEVTGECALKLADAGKHQEAVDVAKMIGVLSDRADVLKKLAEKKSTKPK